MRQMLNLIHLTALMQRSEGSPTIRIGLIDGPIAAGHPDLASPIVSLGDAACERFSSAACTHGSFVAGIFGARRGSAAPALCPQCPLLVRPVFLEADGALPRSSAGELAQAIEDVIGAGACIVNLSLALTGGPGGQEGRLREVLDWAAQKGVLVVAAAGNEGRIGTTVLTRHPWVLPVVSCDAEGRPSPLSNLSLAIARNGLMAPGGPFVSLDSQGGTRTGSGTSFAAALVSGIAALLWSLFPQVPAQHLKAALLMRALPQRSLIPLLVDAERAWRALDHNNTQNPQSQLRSNAV